jgi:thiosulfate/3-mercaptopyruvate sulfurtransferase
MPRSPIISAAELSEKLSSAQTSGSKPVVVLDCRHDLADHAAGRRGFLEEHIATAQFWNMETDAVATHTGLNGRHPLPSREVVRDCFARFGVNENSLIVAYDAQSSMYAGRLWWLARWIGHEAIQVLDGGIKAWLAFGGAIETGEPRALPALMTATSPLSLALKESLSSWVDRHQVARFIASDTSGLIDARAPARFRGEVEPLDPVAGHIPGAMNRFFQENLGPDGRFKSPQQLRAEFSNLLKSRSAYEVVHQCGSGVTACHNIIAMELAGLSGSSLYPGSWSEWCAQANAAVAKG